MSFSADRFLNYVVSEIVNLPPVTKSIHTPITQEMVNHLIQLMKQVSPTFAHLEPQILFMGSYFEGLKIVKPDEYDLNIVLNAKKMSVDWRALPAGFTRVQVEPLSVLCELPESRSWANSSGYLQAAHVRQWLQSVIQQALNTLPTDGLGSYILLGRRLTMSSSGPAYTIKLSGRDITGMIDVDLVPTFTFPLDILRQNEHFNKQLIASVSNSSYKKNFFLAVPKGPRGYEPALKDNCWRLDCQQQELELLLDNYNMKPTIRLIKKFRDMQGISLSSYCIKTLFFWEIINRNEQFWKTNSISYLFRHMLMKFQTCLKARFIPNLWFPKQNMLADIPQGILQCSVVYIERMLQYINDGAAYERGLMQLLLDSKEQEQFLKWRATNRI